MNIKTTLFILFSFLTISAFGQNPKFLFGASENPSIKLHVEAVTKKSLDTADIFSAIPIFPESIQERNSLQHFPYPIIFIHGLVGSADSWIDFYDYALNQGWSYGGQLRFNLNADDDLSYSNITLASLSDINDFNNNISAADFYLVNFNCSLTGTSYGSNYNTPTQSNQAAITKQGVAIRQAISYVLSATGKDKVVLFGHSMGGLAARQYLQTPSLWQPDNKHHIAKLVTSGTPHGGSNASFPGISNLIAGVKEGSDAVRDLRRSYFYSFKPGVFLYGGKEDPAIMNDLLLGFNNYDVNCNGITGNQNTGLNQKALSSDLDFSCIISDYFLDPLGGDLVVGLTEAQLKSYYAASCETFSINAFHTSMPKDTKANFEAFDEPDSYDLSYFIDKNTDYNGFITLQAPDADYDIDYDDFVFKTTQPGFVSVIVDNIDNSLFPFGVSILDHPNKNYIFDQVYQNVQIQTNTFQLPSGTYYLEFYANGSSTTWQYPYSFKVVWNAMNPTSTIEAESKVKINISPNPTFDQVTISLDNEDYVKGTIKIQNEFGQEIYNQPVEGVQIRHYIDFNKHPNGVYFVTFTMRDVVLTMKLIRGI